MFLFKGMKTSQIEELCSLLNPPKSFKKGDVIYSANNFSNAIGYIVKGTAFALSNSGELFMRSFKTGETFGAAAVFGGENYVSSIIAKTDTEVLFITEEQLKEIFIKFPETSLNYISFLSDKIRFLNTKLALLSCISSEQTLYSYLCSVSDRNGVANTPKSMTLLAKMLGISRASLYRSLDALQESKLILRENNIIKVIKNEKNS